MAAHGRYGVCGSCRLAGGGKFAVLVIVSVVVLPEGLFAKIFAGLSVHVAVEIDAGAAHVKFTSAGNVEPVGVVVNVNEGSTYQGALRRSTGRRDRIHPTRRAHCHTE